MAIRWPKRRGEGGLGASQNEQNGNYTFVLSDANNIVAKLSGGAGETYTIPANASVPFPVGTIIAVSNDGGDDLTIVITTDTLEGTDGTTGSRTLTNNNTATLEKLTTTKWRYTSTDGASGATPAYASFYNSSAGNTNVTTTEQQATLNATLVNSDTGVFSLATDTVTVNKTADFKITYDLSIQQDSDAGDSRSTIDMWIDIDTVEVSGSRCGFYTRGFSTKTSGSVTLITSITSGEDVTFAWQGGSGSDDLDEVANYTRVTFEEMV
jgi:hypothetical protein